MKRAQIPGVLWPSWQGSVWCCPAVAAAATSWVPSVEGICCGLWQGRFIIIFFLLFFFFGFCLEKGRKEGRKEGTKEAQEGSKEGMRQGRWLSVPKC